MSHPSPPSRPLTEAEIFAITRPDPVLWRYYMLNALAVGPFFPVALLLLYFRYHTLSYRFDSDGMAMSWGILFRREIHLTYARIQDIHLTSNIVERWLGLARVQIQTASGSAEAEMTIEGVRAFLPLRDYLYSRMRGVKSRAGTATAPAAGESASRSGGDPRPDSATVELAAVLREVAVELRAVRAALEAKRPGGGDDG